jgi:hypothetical protein
MRGVLMDTMRKVIMSAITDATSVEMMGAMRGAIAIEGAVMGAILGALRGD